MTVLPAFYPATSCLSLFVPDSYGGAEGIRTPDLFNAIEALSQLSYSPIAIL